MTRLIIARHGNTFDQGDTILRVGLRTDLALSKSGQAQAVRLGQYLKNAAIKPVAVFCSELQRTMQTAKIALDTAKIAQAITTNAIFNEIDYGEDDGRSEAEVVTRLGQKALAAWDNEAIVPDGWQVDSAVLIKNWQNFADEIAAKYPEQDILVVSSNGIVRFAPYITGQYEQFKQQYNIKLSTGAYGILQSSHGLWQVINWNIRP